MGLLDDEDRLRAAVQAALEAHARSPRAAFLLGAASTLFTLLLLAGGAVLVFLSWRGQQERRRRLETAAALASGARDGDGRLRALLGDMLPAWCVRSAGHGCAGKVQRQQGKREQSCRLPAHMSPPRAFPPAPPLAPLPPLAATPSRPAPAAPSTRVAAPDTARVEWLNTLNAQLWPHIEAAASKLLLKDAFLERLLNETTFWRPQLLMGAHIGVQAVVLGQVRGRWGAGVGLRQARC